MKSIIACALVVLAVVAMVSSDKTTQPPKLCEIVCPMPLPEITQLLPSPTRCEEYCQCDNRGAILQTCPILNQSTGERLYFNADIQVCDWPLSSGCTNE